MFFIARWNLKIVISILKNNVAVRLYVLYVINVALFNYA